MSLEVERKTLEKACREMIETILFCLPDAFKGTIYRIGKAPDLIAERITSGVMEEDGKSIAWGLPSASGYNPPGKPWLEYRDEPDRPLEAMAWCVERQQSWTSEDPANDARSVRLQVKGIFEDYHHMEPVLVRKSDLNLDMQLPPQYPRRYDGETIWQEKDYVVVGVVKIHFKPHSIRIGSRETKVIKKLSRSLGTELLSYQLRQDTIKAMEKLAKDRLNACNILADSLRNAITKSGLIFSLLKQEIGFLREQWEKSLLKELNEADRKAEAIKELNEILFTMGDEYLDLRTDLVDVQNKFLELSIPPKKGENWVIMQIEERWKELLQRYPQDSQKAQLIWKTIDRLKQSLYFGKDPKIIMRYNKIPEEVKQEWIHLIYGNNDRFNVSHLNRLIQILGHPDLKIPYREKATKAIIQLKALAETMNTLESNTNFLIHQVLNGG